MKKLLEFSTIALLALAIWMFLKGISEEYHENEEDEEPDFFDPFDSLDEDIILD